MSEKEQETLKDQMEKAINQIYVAWLKIGAIGTALDAGSDEIMDRYTGDCSCYMSGLGKLLKGIESDLLEVQQDLEETIRRYPLGALTQAIGEHA